MKPKDKIEEEWKKIEPAGDQRRSDAKDPKEHQEKYEEWRKASDKKNL